MTDAEWWSGVSTEAAEAAMSLGASKGNPELPWLVAHLSFEYEQVDGVVGLFVSEGIGMQRRRRLAVGGRLLVAWVRWLDDLADEGRRPASVAAVHRLSDAVYQEAVHILATGAASKVGAAYAAEVAGRLSAGYAASVCVDSLGWEGGGVDLEGYAAQAERRAMIASAAVEVALACAGAGAEEISRARRCLRLLAVGWQLYDDACDLEDDYREGSLSWIVSEVLAAAERSGERPDAEEFMRLAVESGALIRGLRESERYYSLAAEQAGGVFVRARLFCERERARVVRMAADVEGC